MVKRALLCICQLGCLLLAAFGNPLQARAGEPPADPQEPLAEGARLLERLLSETTPEEVVALLREAGKPRQPKDLAGLREDYDGKALKFLLAVRNGRAEKVRELHKELELANGPDAWGSWDDLPDWVLKRRREPAEVYVLGFDAADLFQEAALQATVKDDPAVWTALRPVLEALVANSVVSPASAVMLEGEMRELEALLERIDPDVPLIEYRFGKAATIREPAVCFLAADNSLKSEILRAFLEAGANPDLGCLDDWTPLALAVLRGTLSNVSVLLDHEANPNTKSHGLTPLQLVESSSLSEFLKRELNKRLVEHGAMR